MKRVLCVVAVVLLACSFAYAANESALVLSSFAIESQGGGSFGLVSITGQHNNSGIVNIQASAFENDYTLTDLQISQLSEFHPNGIQLSYGGGIGGVPGRIFVQFRNGVVHGFEKTATLVLTAEGDAWLDTSSNVFYEAD